MTPSGWHDDAQSRDAGHDEMQLWVFEHMRDRDVTPWQRKGDDRPFLRTGVYFEMPICRDGRAVAWGDVAEIWDQQEGYRPKRHIRIFEIKPRIYSIGAVMRQCAALEIVAESALALPRESWRPEVVVWPVVKADDPKLSLLRRVCQPVWAWNGEALRNE